MTRLLSLFALSLSLVLALSGAWPAAAHADQRADVGTRLADRAAELRERRISPPKLGARDRSAINAQVASIDGALEVLANGGDLSDARVAQLLGEEPTRATTREDRIARLEARLDGPRKLGTLGRERHESQLAALRAGDMRVAEATPPARALELERAAIERRLVSGPKVGQSQRARMRERIEEIDTRLAKLEREARLQVTDAD